VIIELLCFVFTHTFDRQSISGVKRADEIAEALAKRRLITNLLADYTKKSV